VAGLGWYPCSMLKHNMLSIEEVKLSIITSDIKLVSYSSTITMLHGSIYIRCFLCICSFLPSELCHLKEGATALFVVRKVKLP